MLFKKKPVVIEAFQYDGDFVYQNGEAYVPEWALEALENETMFYGGEPQTELYINTLEGVHHVSVDDYVIKGVKGELYPCKPDIFEMTYEKVE